MPRIDPVQLLRCLSVLLSPSGGIKSKDEVQRLASLMTKFSKKLVSKCIYIQILKRTETELLGSFMGAGGWNLTHMWLTDGIMAKNWPLIQELIELLLLCPVDVERLKTNNCPKLVKDLTKETSQGVIHLLATKLVEQWLKLVKGESAPPLVLSELPKIVASENMQVFDDLSSIKLEIENNYASVKKEEESDSVFIIKSELSNNLDRNEDHSDDDKKGIIPILKITVKDGKQVVSTKVSDKKDSHRRHSDPDKKHRNSIDSDRRESDKSRSDSDKSRGDSSKSSSSKSSKSSHSKSSSSRHSSSSKSHRHSSSSSKDSDKHRDRKHGDRDRSSDKIKESNSDKHKESDKSKEAKKSSTDKLEPPSITKLGKIPKKSSEPKKDKPSISIEVRKPSDTNRPKTVKMYNSKFRSHGLEEEAKPPPPRGTVKKPVTLSTPLIGTPTLPKRASPIRTTEAPPEKRAKIAENTERPGAIKIISPKPKPSYLLESGSFMDALTASATNKKEPRKRKRRISGSKENTSHSENSPPTSPNTSINTSQPSTPQEESKPTPFRFYQDTLDTEEEDKDKSNTPKSPIDEDKAPVLDNPASPSSPSNRDEDRSNEATTSDSESRTTTTGGLKGVLCVHKRKGPKKTLRWRDTNLEDVQYFELDETERVNVTKTFIDLKAMEHTNEREAMQKGRNLSTEDIMEERMAWRKPIPIDVLGGVPVEPGKHSKEKITQLKRQAGVLQALYFHKSMIPDSPAEADFENLPISEPTIIPLDDVNGNPDSVRDFQNTPWPEPKLAPPSSMPIQGQPMFQQMPPGFNPGFGNVPFGMPGFPQGPPGMMPGGPPPGDWQMNGPMMMDNMNMSPDMYMGAPGPGMGPGPMYPGPMGDYPMMEMNGGPNFQSGYMGPNGPGSMNRPMGPPGPNSGPFFQNNRGSMRGGPPNRGGPHWRTSTPGNWNGPHRGGVNKMRGKGRVCSHFQKRGSCREGDSCQFLHSR